MAMGGIGGDGNDGSNGDGNCDGSGNGDGDGNGDGLYLHIHPCMIGSSLIVGTHLFLIQE